MNVKLDVQYQSETNECGLACIAMLATHLGRECWLEDLRLRFVPSGRGTSAATLIQNARELGFLADAVRLKAASIGDKHLPLIIHWNSDHYVILERLNERQAVVVDPSLGRRVLRRAEFEKSFNGVAITLRLPPGDAASTGRKRRPGKYRRLSPVLRFLGLNELRGGRALGILALVLVTELVGLASPIFISKAINLAQNQLSALIHPLIELAVVFIGLSLIQGATLYTRGYLIGRMSSDLLSRWTERAYRHLLSLPLSYFLSRSVGGVTSRLSSLRSLQTLFTGRFVTGGLDIFVALVAMVAAWRYAPWAVAVILITMTVYAIFRVIINKRSAFYAEMSLMQLAQQDAQLVDSVKGIATLKAGLNVEDRIIRYRDIVANTLEYQEVSQKYNIALEAMASAFTGIQRIIVVSIGVYFVTKGGFSVAYLAAMITYLDILSNRVSRLIDTANDMVNVALHLSRLRDVVRSTSEPAASSSDTPLAQNKQHDTPRMRLVDLSFRHAGAKRDLFSSVSLDIEANERVTIIGRSGEGKSTLLMVAAGLLDANSGRAEIDGLSVSDLGAVHYRRRIGVVLQEDYLFPGSLLENISSFDTSPSQELALECCAIAGISDEVRALPMGLFTRVADGGSNFSGGQRQRLCLARALYKKPRILILDESSSHLDTETEKAINERLRSVDVAILSVAHRQETIDYADRVFSLDGGRLRLVADSKARKTA
jgi:ATP-binding cassette subfamily B protein RaxB